jgi:hypothetical protein
MSAYGKGPLAYFGFSVGLFPGLDRSRKIGFRLANAFFGLFHAVHSGVLQFHALISDSNAR